MEGNEKEQEESDKNPEGITNTDSLFSKEEINTIVKEFVTAYIRGDVTIDFDAAQDLMAKAKIIGQKMDWHTAMNQEQEHKEPVLNLIAICAGTKQASSEERQNSINKLFKLILNTRSSDRLHGKFMTFDVEKRLRKLEQDLNETNKIVSEIIMTVQSLLSERKKP